MPLVVWVKPRARREINTLAAWWAENRLAAPGAVATDLRDALNLLAEFPGIGTRVENSCYPDTRFWPIKRLGYDLNPPKLRAFSNLSKIVESNT